MIVAADGGVQGGVELVVRYQPKGWSVESMHFHRPNMVSYEVATNIKRTLIIGAYLPPSTLEHSPELQEALTRLRDQDTILLGDQLQHWTSPEPAQSAG